MIEVKLQVPDQYELNRLLKKIAQLVNDLDHNIEIKLVNEVLND